MAGSTAQHLPNPRFDFKSKDTNNPQSGRTTREHDMGHSSHRSALGLAPISCVRRASSRSLRTVQEKQGKRRDLPKRSPRARKPPDYALSSSRQHHLDLSAVAKHARAKSGTLHVRETLAGLPDKPVYWGSLTTLYLSGNQLPWLPESIGTLKSLKELWVSDNLLTKLPDTLGALDHLIFLRANNNKLETLPSSIGNLKQLQRLHLGRNGLKCIPESLCQLRQLRELLLFCNDIVHLPESIGYLHELVKLNVRENKLWRLPDSVGWLSKLKSCKTDGNPRLQEFPKGTETAIARLIVRQCHARLHRAVWTPRNHGMFGPECNKIFAYAMLSGNRIGYLPPLVWETIFSSFRGSDIAQLVHANEPAKRRVFRHRTCAKG